MIDLYSVKKYNTYDFVQDTLPATDGTWLCSLTDSGYIRGYSYQVTGGTATRIESIKDELISDAIYPTIQNVFDWLNNSFYVRRALQETRSYSQRLREYTFFPLDLRNDWATYYSDTAYYNFASGVVSTFTEQMFNEGDLVRLVGGLRNNVVSYVTASDTTTITLDNGEIVDTDQNSVIFLCDMPKVVANVISQMIKYDVFDRPSPSSLGGESIGNYSYSKEVLVKNKLISVGSIDYPSDFVQTLMRYRRARFVA